ncbi:MAG: PD-(D/E)XK nuclease family protein [Gammaproteobacteria bacterium]|nr:PD-(D/E)XK nuclease family protein [Gammaproteobacteria bacterium]
MAGISTPDTDGGEFLFVEHGVNLQQVISEYIYQHFKPQLPDLTELVIFVPAPDLIYTFRKSLLAYLASQQVSAIIGAEISPLKKWIETNISLAEQDATFINNHCRQLIILEALQAYPAHFENENLWQVSASLLQLFDELSLNDLNPTDFAEADWVNKIKTLYGTPSNPEHLSNEAQLVYTLWQAWQQQLSDEKLLDQTTIYAQRLKNISAQNIKNKCFIIAGAQKLTSNELLLIKKLALLNPVRFFIQASPADIHNQQHPDHFIAPIIQSLNFKETVTASQKLFDNTINCAFQHQLPLHQRAELINHSDVSKGFKVFAAVSEEDEANAVDLQVRKWLLQGKRNIAVVTENRKLARRLRALLERSGVNLVDSVGWSLSTTNAASIVERWLECIEQDFSAITFLDFLKSPFFTNPDDDLLAHSYRFEQDIVYHEKVTANIKRYLNALKLRKDRLTHWESDCYLKISQLLSDIETFASPLLTLFHSNEAIPASQYLDALSLSLTQLGISASLQQNEAGENVLAEITHMLNACAAANPKMNWFDFRTWLASSFENHHYSPSSAASHVRLLNLSQSNSGYYDGLIIASADATQLPGSAPKTPFFNHSVRQSLGLPDWKQKKSEQYYLFRRLLQSADDTLLSYCAEKDNETQQASPWLQTIIDLYQRSDDSSLSPTELYSLLKTEKTTVLASKEIPLPELAKASAPAIEKLQIPDNFSASRHQRLINCPYQFFANDVLKLTAPEELVLELQKSEYGQKVHKILELYHLSDEPKTCFDSSLVLLRDISERIFRQDVEDNFLHRGWLKRWLDHCDSYLKWQQQREKDWTFYKAETDQQTTIADNIELKGRIDRIDKQQSGFGIIDYKTSSQTASQSDVIHGEDIQLSNYALLMEKVTRVEYLKLDDSYGKVSSGASLEDEELTETTARTQKRFIQLLNEMQNHTPLISNGHDDICQFCKMSGLCRKDFWTLNQPI